MTVTTPDPLLALKLRQLRHWAFLIGMPTGGTKIDLAKVLAYTIRHSPFHNRDRQVVSVDMGIRNFAFCKIRVPASSKLKNSKPSPLMVLDWQRRDLLSHKTLLDKSQILQDAIAEPGSLLMAVSRKRKGAVPDSTAFTLPAMSRMAYDLSLDLLAGQPDEILIERQFLPRGPGARVTSEWTLRINKLEGMLWASLETSRHRNGTSTHPFLGLHAVNPDRVAAFWSSATSLIQEPPPDLLCVCEPNKLLTSQFNPVRRKVDKREKIAIVRSWIAGDTRSPVVFSGQAERVAEVFKMKKLKDAEAIAGGKIDDLADCLLQAVTWARWEENRQIINRMWEEAEASDRGHTVPEDTLKGKVKRRRQAAA